MNWRGTGSSVSASARAPFHRAGPQYVGFIKRLPPGPVNREPLERWIDQRIRPGKGAGSNAALMSSC